MLKNRRFGHNQSDTANHAVTASFFNLERNEFSILLHCSILLIFLIFWVWGFKIFWGWIERMRGERISSELFVNNSDNL